MLIDKQECELAAFIEEDFGGLLDEDEFVDRCRQLFEDIAGFECLSDKQIRLFTSRIWSHYVERRNKVCNTKKS